eukprot:5544571-Pyramimonas_sp.AAC.2
MMKVAGVNRMKIVPGPLIEFTFGNIQKAKSLDHASIPGNVDGQECDFPVSVVEVEAPLLIGMDFLKHVGVIVDFELGAIRSRTLGSRTRQLERSMCGHLLIDFGPEAEWGEVITHQFLLAEASAFSLAQDGDRAATFATEQLPIP